MNIAFIKTKYNSLPLPMKASLWYTMANVVNKGISLLSTPIFTRIMNEEQYGTFSIFQSWFSIMIIFTSLNVFLGGYSKGLILYEDDAERFTSSQLGLTTVITAIVFAIYIADISFWTKVFELSPILMIAMFIELLLMPAMELWSARQRFDYKYRKFVLLTVAMSGISIIGGVIAVTNTYNKIEARVFSDVFAKAFFSVILFIVLFSSGKCFYNKEYWKYSLTFNLPLIPHYLSNYVLNQSDRVMIGKMVGNSQAAYYSVAYTISTVIILIVNAINSSLTPYIYKSIAANEKEKIKKATQPLIILVAGLCVMTMTFAPEVIRIFAGKKYTDAIYVIPPIAASVFFIFAYSLFSNIEYYFQKTKLIAVATSMCAVLNLILNYVCIKKFGYYAAGYTTLVCYGCLTVFHYAFYKKVLIENHINVDLYNKKYIVIASVTLIVIMVLMTFIYEQTVFRYGLMIILFIIIIMFRNKFAKILFALRKRK